MATWIVSLSVLVVVYLIISGLDDLAIDMIWWWQAITRPPVAPSVQQLDQTTEQRIAIFVPLWHEHGVIEQMLSHNLAAIQYSCYTIFVGVYPNDPPTLEAVARAAQRFPNVRIAQVPHPGPTSKADCLNSIYQQMLLEEEAQGVRFETVITHDAEDIIHPQAFRWINYTLQSQGADFVQIPVLALSTPLLALTHGIYCDEFAEMHTRDLTVRCALGAFVPSAGVGTGYSRRALEALAAADSNIFIPGCLTEDYENGLRLNQLGFRQAFVPILKGADGTFVATREFFPQSFWSSVRQRSRWVTGIALQSWERNGWRGDWKTRYWFWRDRKGLIGGPLGLLTTAMFLAACVWRPHWSDAPAALRTLFEVTMVLGIYRINFRMICVMRVYGGPMAAMVPVRVFWSNWINGLATIRAMGQYASARFRGTALAWTKTTHEYPTRAVLVSHALKIGEILVQNRIVERALIERAEANRAELRLGEYLVRINAITEQQLYQALALQQQLPLVAEGPLSIPRRVARALPCHLIRDWKVIPFAIDEQGVQLCTPEAPPEELTALLRRYTGLAVRFHLIPASRFESLALAVLHSKVGQRQLSLAAGD